jgi:hypothetical protein
MAKRTNMAKSDTPLLDELEKGKWPSFVKDMKQAAQKNPMARDLIQQLELSYKDRIGHWKHGGIVGVKGYGAGVIGRYSDRPDLFPNVQAFHTMRVNHPTGWFYKTDTLRKLCDIWATTVGPPLPARTCQSSEPGRTTFRSIRRKSSPMPRASISKKKSAICARRAAWNGTAGS